MAKTPSKSEVTADTATAASMVREAADLLVRLLFMVKTGNLMRPDLWDTNHIEPPDFNAAGLDDAADAAFPEQAAELKAAFAAASTFYDVHERFHADPWPHPFPWDEEAKAAAAPRMEEAEKAVRDFIEAVEAIGALEV